MIYVALKYPVLLAIFGFNGSVVLPLLIVGLAKYGPIVVPLFLVAESPIIYMVVKEALRQIKQLPLHRAAKKEFFSQLELGAPLYPS